jgi:RNA polymerase sigma-70 factor (ECF subfamily)
MDALTVMASADPDVPDLDGCGHLDDPPWQHDADLLARLRAGEEAAFAALVGEHTASMLSVAGTFVRSGALAEEVVQQTWLAVLRGLDRFEGRSSLKTWIYRILVNVAKTSARREGRSLSLSSLTSAGQTEEAGVDEERFLPADHDRWPGHWAIAPESWASNPEDKLLATEAMSLVEQSVQGLPDAQRMVITLRDIEGWTSEEVCGLLQISAVNQRVLLHRARSRVRAELERYLSPPATSGQ